MSGRRGTILHRTSVVTGTTYCHVDSFSHAHAREVVTLFHLSHDLHFFLFLDLCLSWPSLLFEDSYIRFVFVQDIKKYVNFTSSLYYKNIKILFFKKHKNMFLAFFWQINIKIMILWCIRTYFYWHTHTKKYSLTT